MGIANNGWVYRILIWKHFNKSTLKVTFCYFKVLLNGRVKIPPLPFVKMETLQQ